MRAYNGRNTNKGMANWERNTRTNIACFIKHMKEARASLCNDHEFAYKVDIHWIDDIQWAGNYGHVGTMNLRKNTIESPFYKEKFIKNDMKFLHDLCGRTDLSVYWFINYDEPDYDGPNKYYGQIVDVFVFRNTSELVRSERYMRDFIKMSNGQLFDIENQYWFTVSDSKILNEWLEDGYHYWDPQSFFQDLDEENN